MVTGRHPICQSSRLKREIFGGQDRFLSDTPGILTGISSDPGVYRRKQKKYDPNNASREHDVNSQGMGIHGRGRNLLFFPVFFLCLALCPVSGAMSQTLFGKASYYSDKLHNRKTASGEPYDKGALTAAHRTLPLGTVVRVTNLHNNRQCVVRINDRGPVRKSWLIDLSRETASRLKMLRRGIADVRVDILSDRHSRCLPGNAFYVRLMPTASPEKGRASLNAWRIGKRISPGQAPNRVRDRTLAQAEIFMHTDAGKKHWFIGFGPFSSFREAEKVWKKANRFAVSRQGMPVADFLCIPHRKINVVPH